MYRPDVAATLGRERWCVIPLNSPPHYPPYNGGVEHGQREIKVDVMRLIDPATASDNEFRLACRLAGHERNQYRRTYDRFRRKEVLDTIKAMAVDITALLGNDQPRNAQSAWRYAVEQWMQRNNVMRITRNGDVLPYYHRLLPH
jgi:hypothetical protein